MACSLELMWPQSVSEAEYFSNIYTSVLIYGVLGFKVQDCCQQFSSYYSPYWGTITQSRGLGEVTSCGASVLVKHQSETILLKNECGNSYHRSLFCPSCLGWKCNFTYLFICRCYWCSWLSFIPKRKTSSRFIFAVVDNFETTEIHTFTFFPLHHCKMKKKASKRERINT